MHYNLIVIGGGSGGLACARRASKHKASVLLIEKSRLGGTCVNVGCVPKKICYNLVSLKHSIDLAKDYGFLCKPVSLDFNKFVEKREAYIKKLNGIYKINCEKENVTVVDGYGRLTKDGVRVGDKLYTFDKCVLATGAKAKDLVLKKEKEKDLVVKEKDIKVEDEDILIKKEDIKMIDKDDSKLKELPTKDGIDLDEFENDYRKYLKTSDDFFSLTEIPKKAVFIGSGYIAIELAFVIATFGCEVTLVARGDKLLSHFDEIIGDSILESLEKSKVKVLFNTDIVNVKEREITVKNKNTGQTHKIQDIDFIMSAIGRDCDLSFIEIDVEKRGNYLKVNDNYETSIENVYAIGDLIGPNLMLTPYAIYTARHLADYLFKPNNDNNDNNKTKSLKEKFRMEEYVASVIFSHPPSASVGLSEKEAKKKHENVKCYLSKFTNLFFGIVDESNKERSIIKIITANSSVVGIHMVGMGADEIVQGFAVALKAGLSVEQLLNTVGVHPTAAEEIVTIKMN